MISLNGISLPSPTSLSVRVSPQAGTAQYNTLGQTVLDGWRDKRTVEIGWKSMAGAALAQLSQLLSAGGFFTLVYPDGAAGAGRPGVPLSKRRAPMGGCETDPGGTVK